MQIGDLVQVTGTVKDIVPSKDTTAVNVLVGTDPDGREYWFQSQHVALQSVLTKAEEAEATKEAAAATSTTKTATVSHTTASKH